MLYKYIEPFAVLFLFITTCHLAGAQELIKFQQPQAFKCGKSISWKDLDTWRGINNTSICGNEPYYSVRGTVDDNRAYKVSAEIYVPEANKSWPASGGTFKSIDPSDGTFIANFCIPEKGLEREFWFQLYSNDKSPIGEKCIIKVPEAW